MGGAVAYEDNDFLWKEQHSIQNHCYLKAIVDFYGMNYTEILCRKKGETYSEIVEQLKPDILIEDDCKSIGGLKECCITHVKEEIKQNIQSIIVPEFAGIDGIAID